MEQDDMRILYKYLTTSLFPRHIEPEVWLGTNLPLSPQSVCVRILCAYTCTHTPAHPGWAAGEEGEVTRWWGAVLTCVLHCWCDTYLVGDPLAQNTTYASSTSLCYVPMRWQRSVLRWSNSLSGGQAGIFGGVLGTWKYPGSLTEQRQPCHYKHEVSFEWTFCRLPGFSTVVLSFPVFCRDQ